MITDETMTAIEYVPDAELVSRTLGGDRDAFNRIVSRYQILICSLAYSRIGHLGQSEDVAQETFITAWKHLRLLRQPEKLRGWLCGIVRNRTKKCLEREGRQPWHDSEPLDAVAESPALDALPSEQAITREEEAILWRTLQRLPELYREPLILYYRERQSIEHVAAELELSEDAVKQRLSRGRKLLQEGVEAFVENVLRQTTPNQAFSSAVIAALPLAGAPAAAGAGMAGKGTLAIKSLLAAFLLPFVGVFTGFAAQWLMFKDSRCGPGKPRLITTWIVILVIVVGGQLAVRFARHYFSWSDPVFFIAMAGFWWIFTMGLATWIIPIWQRTQARTIETMRPVPPLNYAAVVAGTHLMIFWGFILLAWQEQDRLGAMIIAGLMTALGVWNFFKTRDRNGVVFRSGYIIQIASCSALMLGILNLRLDLWLAHAYGISVAQLHERMPFWMVPLLTLALLLWSVALLAMTKPKKGSQRMNGVDI